MDLRKAQIFIPLLSLGNICKVSIVAIVPCVEISRLFFIYSWLLYSFWAGRPRHLAGESVPSCRILAHDSGGGGRDEVIGFWGVTWHFWFCFDNAVSCYQVRGSSVNCLLPETLTSASMAGAPHFLPFSIYSGLWRWIGSTER